MGIGGSEWIIIGLITIFLLFGSKKLPDIARHIGKAFGEYNNTKQTLLGEINKVKSNNNSFDHHPNEKNLPLGKIIHGPVSTEREKLERIAMSLNIEYRDMSDDQLRLIILQKMKNDNF
ncbi:MAG TPA: twin-arginine translocase TatA/TatE family subunit [Nitrososphaeraceae archaeon]|nr:twin-arginine translocase TatA/TatE family subunit [Nitrososphaeraceae archaeon]